MGAFRVTSVWCGIWLSPIVECSVCRAVRFMAGKVAGERVNRVTGRGSLLGFTSMPHTRGVVLLCCCRNASHLWARVTVD